MLGLSFSSLALTLLIVLTALQWNISVDMEECVRDLDMVVQLVTVICVTNRYVHQPYASRIAAIHPKLQNLTSSHVRLSVRVGQNVINVLKCA